MSLEVPPQVNELVFLLIPSFNHLHNTLQEEVLLGQWFFFSNSSVLTAAFLFSELPNVSVCLLGEIPIIWLTDRLTDDDDTKYPRNPAEGAMILLPISTATTVESVQSKCGVSAEKGTEIDIHMCAHIDEPDHQQHLVYCSR